MVEIFRTSVKTKLESLKIIKELSNTIQQAQVNFDLEDTDNILRIEAPTINVQQVYNTVSQRGLNIERIE